MIIYWNENRAGTHRAQGFMIKGQVMHQYYSGAYTAPSASGLAIVTFSTTEPAVAFSTTAPAVAFTGAKPGVTFTS